MRKVEGRRSKGSKVRSRLHAADEPVTSDLRPSTLSTLSTLPIRRGLQVEEFGVTAALQQQLVVGAEFDDVAAFEDHDPVGEAHGGEAVRDEERRLVGGQLLHPREDLVLGLRVE